MPLSYGEVGAVPGCAPQHLPCPVILGLNIIEDPSFMEEEMEAQGY